MASSDGAGQFLAGGKLASQKGGMSRAQQGEQIERRRPVAVRRGGGDPVQGAQRGVLPARHSEHKVVVNQHRDINVQLRGVDQVQQPDHRPSIADHDDGFQPLGSRMASARAMPVANAVERPCVV